MTRSYQEIEEIVVNFGYVLLKEYMNGRQRRVIIQDADRYKYDLALRKLIDHEGRANFVDISNPFTLENIKLWLKINRPEFKLLDSNVYSGNHKKMSFYHTKCKENFVSKWSKIYFGEGCAVCRGLQIGKYNNLEYLNPSLAKEFHLENKLKSNEVTTNSHQKIYWICPKCEYGKNKEWFVSVDRRSHGIGCPACSKPCKVVTDINRLSVIYPDIASEWDYELNDDTPRDVSYGKNKKRWWICSEGHSYFSLISDRTKGKGCKKCSNERQESKVATGLKKYFIEKYNSQIEYEIFTNLKTGSSAAASGSTP